MIAKRNEPVYPSIAERVGEVVYGMWQTTSAPTQSYRDNYRIASNEFKPVLSSLKKLVEIDLKNLENELEKLKAPYTPGRIPDWKE